MDSVIISLVGPTSGQQGWTYFNKVGPTMGRRSIRTWTVHCLDGRGSFSNKDVFSWCLRLTGALTTHNTLHLSFVHFSSNRCWWFHVHPKKPQPLPCRPKSQSSPFSNTVRLQKSTILTIPLSLECSGVSMFRPQLCIDAETHQDCDGKASK